MAGETVFKRGQDYELRGRVRELAATPEGGLVAWVQGSQSYATRVTLRTDQLSADCTCPYGGTCKHAMRAAAIWQGLAEVRLAQTSPAAYQEAAVFLRKLRRVWAQRGKVVAWRGYVEQLRATNKRKRRLVETLDVLLQERGRTSMVFLLVMLLVFVAILALLLG